MDDAARASAPAAVTVSAAPVPSPPSATTTAAAAADTSSPDPSALYEEGMWQQMAMNSGAAMQPGPYPERSGEPDCTYYLRTGLCRFGMSCRFNHPPDRNLAIASARMKGEYPERVGQPECQYYLKTGTCKFGPTCKFHHPREKAGIAGRVQLNTLGYPLRPVRCLLALYVLPYLHMTVLCQLPYACSSSQSQLQSPGAQQTYGTSQQGESSAGNQGMLSPYRSSSYPVPQYALQRENVFPERPDQPECQYYMKTGDCKFGVVCKFHHPRVRSLPPPDCVLSPMGLPLRPGEELCKFYSRYGICKFGANCKFDHPMAAPMGVYAYGFSTSASPASASTNVPMARRLLGSTSGSGYTS
ncbi:hypothetical protein EJB05_17956 [Eragrostis curvula]|uniref:C3H1-type domain-containing protein n=1 Tax=Eragrostis curvula TaxID=38414 RepID=A0A5J9VKH4_9POAL|nr:hypothetical protein EJB05_17956 [Eragrostis curvula]